jgi:hypothetical protein
VGVKVTVTVQVAPAASVVEQVVEAMENSVGLVPVSDRLTVSGPLPVLFSVSAGLFVGVLTSTAP